MGRLRPQTPARSHFGTPTLSSSQVVGKVVAIQAALAAFPPPKAASQASRLRLVTRPTSNPSLSPPDDSFPVRAGDELREPLRQRVGHAAGDYGHHHAHGEELDHTAPGGAGGNPGGGGKEQTAAEGHPPMGGVRGPDRERASHPVKGRVRDIRGPNGRTFSVRAGGGHRDSAHEYGEWADVHAGANAARAHPSQVGAHVDGARRGRASAHAPVPNVRARGRGPR